MSLDVQKKSSFLTGQKTPTLSSTLWHNTIFPHNKLLPKSTAFHLCLLWLLFYFTVLCLQPRKGLPPQAVWPVGLVCRDTHLAGTSRTSRPGLKLGAKKQRGDERLGTKDSVSNGISAFSKKPEQIVSRNRFLRREIRIIFKNNRMVRTQPEYNMNLLHENVRINKNSSNVQPGRVSHQG